MDAKEMLKEAKRLAAVNGYESTVCTDDGCNGKGVAKIRDAGTAGGSTGWRTEDPCPHCLGAGCVWFDRNEGFAMANRRHGGLLNMQDMITRFGTKTA